MFHSYYQIVLKWECIYFLIACTSSAWPYATNRRAMRICTSLSILTGTGLLGIFFFFVGLVTKLPIYSAEADQATDSIERSNSLQRSLSLQPWAAYKTKLPQPFFQPNLYWPHTFILFEHLPASDTQDGPNHLPWLLLACSGCPFPSLHMFPEGHFPYGFGHSLSQLSEAFPHWNSW